MATEGDAKLNKLKHIIKIQKEAIAEVKRKSKRKQSDIKLDEVTRISAIKKGAALKIAETALKEVEEGTPTEAPAEEPAAAAAEHTAALADTAPPSPAETAPPAPAEAAAQPAQEAASAKKHAAPSEVVEEEVVEEDAGDVVESVEGEAVTEGGSVEAGAKTSGLAIVALIFAFVFPLLGTILGLAAIAKIKKKPTLTGRGLAITAVVIGSILTLAAITLMVLQMTGIYVLI